MPKYGIEERVIKDAPELTDEDVITQSEARVILGISSSAMSQSVNRGRFTIVWSLGEESSGRSARRLLRSEVEAAAAGERRLSSAPHRRAPISGQ